MRTTHRPPSTALPPSSLPATALLATGLLAFFILHSSFFISRAAAQTPTPAPEDDDIVQLGAFTVSDRSQTGYTASESITGTRMPTRIMDLPFNIDVITAEFLDDFAIMDESDILEGGVVTLDLDAGGTQIIRGIKSGGQLYNGFWMPSGVTVPTRLKLRSEVLKGPSAGIYGQTSPGGIVNTISKSPSFKRSQKLNFLYGNYNTLRAGAELTGPITRKTAYLVNVAYDDRKFMQPWRRNTQLASAISIAHSLTPTTKLTVEVTGIKQRNKTPANRIPYKYNSQEPTAVEYTDPDTGRPLLAVSSTGRYYDYAWDYVETSAVGQNSYANKDTYAVFATLETRVNEVISYRIGANFVATADDSFNTTALTVIDPDWSHAAPTNPYAGNIYGVSRVRSDSSSYSAPGYTDRREQNGGIQGDILARYFMASRKIEGRTMLSFDFSTRYGSQKNMRMPQRIGGTNANGSPSTSNYPDPAVFPWDPATHIDYDNPANPAQGKVSEEYFWKNYWLPVVNPLPIADPLGEDDLIMIRSPYVNMDKSYAAYYVPDYDIYHVPDYDPNKWILRTTQTNRRDVWGFMLRQQLTLWRKLIVYGSLRYDTVNYSYTTTEYPGWSLAAHPEYAPWYAYAPSPAKWNSSSWTPATGFNFQPFRWIAFYGNYSTSFNPSSQPVSGASTASLILDNETAWGLDYGVKFNIINGKLTGYLGGFYIFQENMSVTDEDEATGLAVRQAVGQVLSRGVEFSFNYDIASWLSVKGGYYHTNAIWVYSGRDKDLIGRSRANVPPHIFTLTPKLSIRQGLFKGLAIAATWQYSSSCASNENGGIAFGTNEYIGPVVLPGANNGLRDLSVPMMSRYDLSFTYNFNSKLFGLLSKTKRQGVSLVIRNLTDERYITQSRGVGDYRSIHGSYRITF